MPNKETPERLKVAPYDDPIMLADEPGPDLVAIPGHGVETVIPDELAIWEDAAAKAA